MALHGTIAVNGRQVGAWDARRVETHPTGRHCYHWRADLAGERVSGDLWHEYRDGAAVLASLVLAAAGRAARIRPGSQETELRQAAQRRAVESDLREAAVR